MSEATPGQARQFLFLLTSARRDGNSEILAQRAANTLGDDVAKIWLRLLDLPLPGFVDIRHEGEGIYPRPSGAGETLLRATLNATDIVFVSPLYWYGLPSLAKHYLDHMSGWMRVPGENFVERMAGKTMWAVTALSEKDYSVADPLLGTLKLTAAYLHMHWGGALLGYGNRPSEVLADHDALRKADSFFADSIAAHTGSAAHV
jgi:NAD(P)H-dependent FMN reductase